MAKIFSFVIFCASLQRSLQNCPEEYSYNGISVKWSQTPNAFNVESNPVCYMNDYLVKRNCTDDKWIPTVEDVGPCSKVVKSFNSTSCPPGFHKITENNNEYCYQIGADTTWDYPCFSSGGASVITGLDEEETNSIISSLVATNRSRFFWLPAHRLKVFNPVVWSIPGPNWGVHLVPNDHLRYQNFIWKNCLALDVTLRILTTETCTQKYPSLCFYINNVQFPAICPRGYHSFRYKPDNGTCYGIEKSDPDTALSFLNFQKTKCKKPMTNTYPLNRFIFTKIAEINELPTNEWCWFEATYADFEIYDHPYPHTFAELKGIINSAGTLGLINSSSTLSCMACETEVVYGETELMFEYNQVDNKIYLTIYFPSGLWKYDVNDKGIQCFSDATGFVQVVDINDLPFLSVKLELDEGINYIEKIVYIIDLVTQRSAQYWCEGHTVNFSLISTNKLVVNPKGKEIHVFAMTVNYYNNTFDISDTSGISLVLLDLTEMFGAQKILWMDVYDITVEFVTALLHVHTAVVNQHENESLNLQQTYNDLKERALQYLPTVHCSFVNLSSSVYCLPDITYSDSVTLNWELTPIGHISAPEQFCLQSNGLPVRRQCLGSYHNGALWGNVEGKCDTNYFATETTAFLYNVGKGQVPSNYTSRFLIDGLEFVLNDIEIIIPADIYYLSMSLQQVLHVAHENDTDVDIGDIDNIAWVMDRIMEFDWNYLRLAQTLNSTNVILNSVNDIIEMIAKESINDTDWKLNLTVPVDEAYQIAIRPQFVVQISYPMLTNVTGIAISKLSDTDNFTDMIVKPLYANTSLDEVLAIENLEIATWLPLKLINTLRPNCNASESNESFQRNNVHIIISVFQNDAVFQELLTGYHKINSRIVGVSVPGLLSNLENPLPIVFRQLNPVDREKLCGFWDFQMQKSTLLSGFWKTQGCFLVKSMENITICECYHLTHFSQLITIPPSSDNMEHPNIKQHTKALNTITLVGCFLSLIGIFGIWLTALVFANWRKKAGTKILLQLSTAIALPLLFIVIFNLDNSIFVYENGKYTVAIHMKPLCIVLGSLLHYSILSSFMWMLITAVLQFVRYVRVLGVSRPSRFMFKFSLIGWGIPLVPVIIVLAFDLDNYIPDPSYTKRLCYPKGICFILSVLLPICVILFVNVVLFLLVLHSISRGSSNDKMKSTDFDLVGAQLRLSIFLFFLLGLTWLFGIFSFSTNMLWSYLFCLTATMQGFVLFVYFIVCDPTTRNMWITLVKPPFTSGSSRNSITSLGGNS